MGYRLSKIYTRTGDGGTTNMGGDVRLNKDCPRVELIGTIDELNSAIGVVLAHQPQTESVKNALIQIQQELFNLSGELCPPYHVVMSVAKVTQLENWLDEWNDSLEPLLEFILPGGNLKAAHCHMARTICRRAERRAVTVWHEKPFNPDILSYLNRLSDVLFVAARVLNKEDGVKEVYWEHERH